MHFNKVMEPNHLAKFEETTKMESLQAKFGQRRFQTYYLQLLARRESYMVQREIVCFIIITKRVADRYRGHENKSGAV